MAYPRGAAGTSEAGGIAHAGGSHQVEGVEAVQSSPVALRQNSSHARLGSATRRPAGPAGPARAMWSSSLQVIDNWGPSGQWVATIADPAALDTCAAGGTMCLGPILLPA